MVDSKIIEIIGVAGTGKTTITRTLIQNNKDYLIEELPPVRSIKLFPFFVFNFVRTVPLIINLQNQMDRSFSSREITWLVILNSWQKILKTRKKKVVFVDQGPIFLIASLIGLDPEISDKSLNYESWKPLLKRWANQLDAIIYLDADDSDLIQRINQREKEHLVKGKSSDQIQKFLAHNRGLYNTLLEIVQNNNPQLKIFSLNSSQLPLAVLVNDLLSTLDSNLGLNN